MTARTRSRRLRLPPRGRPLRHTKSTILIVGEGQQTEPNYLRGLRQEPRIKERWKVTVKKGPGWTPLAVVEAAVNAERTSQEDFDEVWCVLDVEGSDKREPLEEARRLAKAHGIRLCLSNPSFEVWLLSHFERWSRAYANSDAVIRDLDKAWQAAFGRSYAKNDDRVFGRCAARLGDAIDNARWVREKAHEATVDTADANSSTEMYRLVLHLRGDDAT